MGVANIIIIRVATCSCMMVYLIFPSIEAIQAAAEGLYNYVDYFVIHCIILIFHTPAGAAHP